MSKSRRIPSFLRGLLNEDDMQRITDTIASVEKKTSGELRVSIREKRHRSEKELDLAGVAANEFRRLEMDKTRDATGVLLFFLFSDRKFQILADTGIYTRVPQATWDAIAVDISTHLRAGRFGDGICYGVDECGKLLAREFPIQAGDVNELSNDVSIT